MSALRRYRLAYPNCMAEVCANEFQYGTVERIYIARDVGPPVPVFVKFASPLSALRVRLDLDSFTWDPAN